LLEKWGGGKRPSCAAFRRIDVRSGADCRVAARAGTGARFWDMRCMAIHEIKNGSTKIKNSLIGCNKKEKYDATASRLRLVALQRLEGT